MNRAIIVLGMHRSGTSLIAELLHRWGAFGRVDECLPSNQWNARGYWEFAPLVAFNERLLHAVGADWNFPPAETVVPQLGRMAHLPAYRNEAMALVSSMQQPQSGPWFWKDPRLSLLLPFWTQILDNPTYVVCIRNPIEIGRSLAIRDELSLPVSILVWQRYMFSILADTANQPRIFLNYANVLHHPAQQSLRLCQFLAARGHGAHRKALIDSMCAAIDPHLRHQEAQMAPSSNPLTPAQSSLHQSMERLASLPPTVAPHAPNHPLPFAWRTQLRGQLLLMRSKSLWNRTFPALQIPNSAIGRADARLR